MFNNQLLGIPIHKLCKIQGHAVKIKIRQNIILLSEGLFQIPYTNQTGKQINFIKWKKNPYMISLIIEVYRNGCNAVHIFILACSYLD